MLLTAWNRLLRSGFVSNRRSTRRAGSPVERLESRTLPTLTINFAAGALTISSDGADAIAVAANGSNEVTINGNTFNPGSGNVLASAVTSLSATGGSGSNAINVSGVTAAVFTALTNVTLDGAGGADTLTGSEFGETLIGGSGNDSLAGGAGNDTYQFAAGYGTDTITEAAASGNDTMNFTGVTATLNAGTFVVDAGSGNVATPSGNIETVVNSSGTFNVTTSATNAGTISINAGTLNVTAAAITGGTVSLVGASTLNVTNAAVSGGTLTNSSTGTIRGFGTGTLGGTVSNPAGGQILVGSNDTLVLNGGAGNSYSNAGNIGVNSTGNSSVLRINGDVSLTGGGTLTLSSNGNNFIQGTAATNRLTNVDNTISGAGNIGSNFMALTNQSIISTTGALKIDPSNTGVVNSGTLRVSNGGTLTLEGGSFDNTGGLVRADSSVAASTLNVTGATVTGGTVELIGAGLGTLNVTNAAVSGGTLSNSSTGTIRSFGTGTLGGTVSNPAGGQIVVGSNDTLVLNGGAGNSYSNAGNIGVNSTGNSSVLRINGDVSLTGGGTLTLSSNGNNFVQGTAATNRLTNVDNTIRGVGNFGSNFMAFTNKGTIRTDQAGTLTIDGTGGFTNEGTVDVDPTRTLALGGGDVIAQTSGNTVVDGTLNGSVTLTGGTLSGTGTVSGTVTNTSGTVSAGNSPGRLTVTGNYTQGANGSLAMELGGLTPATEHDQLVVNGTATIAGRLDVSFVNGVFPNVPDTFTILTATTRNGQFDVVDVPSSRNGAALVTDYQTGRVDLRTVSDVVDLLVSSVTGPASAEPGQVVNISYTVQNGSDNVASGSWVDSIYLSQDDTYDASDLLVTRVTHTGGLGSLTSYTENLTAAVPGVLDGNFRFLVIADSRGFTPDIDRANNRAASTAFPVTIPTLDLDAVFNGTIASGQDRYFRVNVASGGDLLLLADFGGAGRSELFLRRGALPTRSLFDLAASKANVARQELLLREPQAGTYFLLIHGRENAGAGVPFTLQAQDLFFRSISPVRGGNNGSTTITLNGGGFTPDAVVELVAPDNSTRTASRVLFKDDNTVSATCDLTGLSPGAYDVRVTFNGTTQTLDNSFTVFASTKPGRVEVTLDSPSSIRPNREGTLTVNYVNVGDTDAVAPLIDLTSDRAEFRFPERTLFAGNAIRVVGINRDGGPAGILPPGARGSIQIKFMASADPTLTLSVVQPEALFDPAAAKVGLRPPGIADDAWDAIFANFLANVGDTIGDVQNVLAENATYLGRLGETVFDYNQLLLFELSQADNFGRLTDRFFLGAFGRGSEDPTAFSAVTQPGGEVEIRSGSRLRSFVPLTATTFTSIGADNGTLRKLGDNSLELTEADGSKLFFRVDGKFDHVLDRNGNRLNANYTGNRLTSFVDPATGVTTSFVYNAQGRITQVTNPNGDVTTLAYDASGEHLLTITDPILGTRALTYNTGIGGPREHSIASITERDGTQTLFGYDNRGRLTSINPPDALGTTTFSYGSTGEVFVTDPDGATVTQLRNPLGDIAQTVDALGRVTQTVFDSLGRASQVILPGQLRLSLTRDARGHIASVTNPLGATVRFTSNASNGEVTQVLDANGNLYQATLDANGNTTTVTAPDNSQLQFEYDAAGRVTRSVNRRNEAIDFTYDPDGRITRKQFPDSTEVNFSYDPRGNLTSMTDTTGTTTFNYDVRDRLIKVTAPSGRFVEYNWNNRNQQTRLRDDTGFELNYEFSPTGLMTQITDGGGNTLVSYDYTPRGRLQEITRGNGTKTTFGFDLAGQLTSVTNLAPNSSVQSRYEYTYDERGLRTSQSRPDGLTSYTYDAAGSLIGVSLSNGRTLAYRYDNNGNRTQVIDSGVPTAYASNNVNEYTSVGAATFAYDADGNLTSRTDASGTTTFTYDAENRLLAMSGPAGTAQYVYDGLGSRVSATRNGVQTNFLNDSTAYHGTELVEYAADGSVRTRNIAYFGFEGRIDAAGNESYFGVDGFSNVTQLTDTNGAVLNSYSYLPFGEVLGMTGSAENPFTYNGYCGATTEPNGMYYDEARFYDSNLGRHLSVNYLFQDNRPMNMECGLFDAGLVPAGGATIITDPGDEGAGAGPEEPGKKPPQNEPERDDGDDAGDDPDIDDRIGSEEDFRRVFGELFDEDTQYGDNTPGPLSAFEYFFPNEDDEDPPSIEEMTEFADSVLNEGDSRSIEDRVRDRYFSYYEHYYYTLDAANIDLGRGYLERLYSQLVDCIVAGGDHDDCLDTFYEAVESRIRVVRPTDPNEIVGPAGVGAEAFVRENQSLGYTIHFENLAAATAAAQEVVITQQLDADLDLTTFEFGDITIANSIIDVPEGLNSFSTQFDDTAVSGLLVNITADLNLATGLVTWTFTSLDPDTGDLPEDPEAGFLPPNVTGPQGEAFVTYSVRGQSGLLTGTRIDALATIVFDTEAPLATAAIFNTIDAGAPTSLVTALPAETISADGSFTVAWTGNDDASGTPGSGIGLFDVFVSDNGGSFQLFQAATPGTSATFAGEFGHTYRFFSVATDNVGHREDDPGVTEATTFVNTAPVADDETAETNEGSAVIISVLVGDTDADNHTLSVATVTQPANGMAAINGNGTITFTPADNFFGETSFSYTLSDGHGGADTAMVTVTVNSVNDEPSFTKGPNEIVAEDTGLHTVANWATAISKGPANEFAQTVSFVVTNNNNALFSVQPAVSPTGTLTFTPAEDATGTATVFVRLMDNGGTENGGVNVSEFQSFTITVNDLPKPEFHPVTITLTAANANTRLRVNAANSHVELVHATTNAVLLDLTVDAVTQLTLNGGREDNRLTLDFTNGNPLPTDGLFFNGGWQRRRDNLVLIGGSFDSVTHTFANRHDGAVTIDGSTITYTGLEPITDNLTAVDRVFEFAVTNDSITLADAASAVNGRLKLSSTRSSETVEFASPTGSLTIRSGVGNDRVTVRSLDNLFVKSNATLIIEGSGGNDSLDASRVSKAVTLRGGSGRDVLFGGSANDVLEGGNARDLLYGNRGHDTLSGDAGNDYLRGGIGDDSLSGGADHDSIRGDAGSDQLFGDAGRDTLRGNADADLVFGGADNDFLTGGFGDDSLSGGGGNDRLFGTEGVDRMRGDGDNDSLRGGSGNDILSGGLGADTVKGDSGTDRVSGGSGGGPDAGDDVLRFNHVNEIDEAFALSDDWTLIV